MSRRGWIASFAAGLALAALVLGLRGGFGHRRSLPPRLDVGVPATDRRPAVEGEVGAVAHSSAGIVCDGGGAGGASTMEPVPAPFAGSATTGGTGDRAASPQAGRGTASVGVAPAPGGTSWSEQPEVVTPAGPPPGSTSRSVAPTGALAGPSSPGGIVGAQASPVEPPGAADATAAPKRPSPRPQSSPAGPADPGPDAASPPDPTDAPPVPTIAHVRMIAEPTEAAIGGTVMVRVLIEHGANVGSVPFHVVFDPSVLRFESGREGAFLRGDGRQTAFFAAPTSQGDAVVVGLSRLGGGEGIGGNGELCELRFTAVGSGPAGLAFRSAKVRDGDNRIAGAVFQAQGTVVR